jgi:hypothetical protein
MRATGQVTREHACFDDGQPHNSRGKYVQASAPAARMSTNTKMEEIHKTSRIKGTEGVLFNFVAVTFVRTRASFISQLYTNNHQWNTYITLSKYIHMIFNLKNLLLQWDTYNFI